MPEEIDEDKKPTIETSDEDLLKLYDLWKRESNNFHEELLKVQELNEQYYLGNQTAKERIPTHKCDAVDNRIFMGVETIVPMITENTPQFVVMPAQENEISDGYANATQEILKIIYESRNVDVRSKLRQATRNMLLYRFGVLSPFWDEEIDDVNVESIRPQRIWIPKYGQVEGDLPFVLRKIDMDFDEIEDFAGAEILEKVKASAGGEEDDVNNELSKTVTVWECWTPEFVFWKYVDVILKKQPNPYFDFTGKDENVLDEAGEPQLDEEGNAVTQNVVSNHFKKPRMPFIFISAYKLGDSLIGNTDLVTQAIPLQDIVNALQRQIVNNANKMGNPAWFVDSDVMDEQEAETKITNEEGLILHGPDAANQNKVRREAPPPLPNYIPNAKIEAANAIDNIMGTHATTRGERKQPETLGGRLLLKQADVQRGGTFVEEIDRAVAELANWFVQLMRLYYEKEKTIKVYGERGIEFRKFSRASLQDGIQAIVKAGSTLQEDEMSQRNEALILWQNGALDPITLFERLKYPNARETAERLLLYQTGQLLPSQQGLPPNALANAKGGVQSNVNPQQEMQEGRQSVTGGV